MDLDSFRAREEYTYEILNLDGNSRFVQPILGKQQLKLKVQYIFFLKKTIKEEGLSLSIKTLVGVSSQLLSIQALLCAETAS